MEEIQHTLLDKHHDTYITSIIMYSAIGDGFNE